MLNSLPPSLRIACAHEFGVLIELVQHANVLAAHRAMYDLGPSALCDGSRCSNGHCAVNDRQGRPEKFDIAGCFADEVLDLEGIADVQDIDPTDRLKRRRKVHTNGIVALAYG